MLEKTHPKDLTNLTDLYSQIAPWPSGWNGLAQKASRFGKSTECLESLSKTLPGLPMQMTSVISCGYKFN